MSLTTYTLEEVTKKIFDDSDGEDDLLDLVPDCDVDSEQNSQASLFTIAALEDETPDNNANNEIEALPRKRSRLDQDANKITSIDTALLEEYYEPIDRTSDVEQYEVLTKKATKDHPEEKIKWTNIPPERFGRQASKNIIRNSSGVKHEYRNRLKIKSSWELFFSLDILTIIVDMTNKNISKVRNELPKNILDDNKYTFLHLTSTFEMLAVIGLIYLRGLLGLASHNIEILFNNLTGNPIFGATMSKNRFKFLLSHISFDDAGDRPERWKYDRFAAFRKIFEIFNYNCGKVAVPDNYLTLDETLYPMRSKLSFKQFNPSKPAKYGMLFRSINSSRFPFTYTTSVYAGRPVNYPSNNCKFYVYGVEETVKSLVKNLEKNADLAGRNLSYDRLYTSIPLAKWLLERKITTIGTIQANRKGIPSEIKQVHNRDNGSYKVFWNEPEKNINLNSFIVNSKTTGKRNILILSTMQPIFGISKDQKKKPALYKLYDYTKGGTDIVDQKISFYSCKTKSRKWTTIAFSYLLDTCRINAASVLAMNKHTEPRKQNSFEVGFNLVLELVKPFIQRRSREGLNSEIQQKIKLVLGENVVEPSIDTAFLSIFPPQSERKRRCEICIKEISGPGMKKKKDQLPKLISQCQNCGKVVCQRHRFQFCNNCH